MVDRDNDNISHNNRLLNQCPPSYSSMDNKNTIMDIMKNNGKIKSLSLQVIILCVTASALVIIVETMARRDIMNTLGWILSDHFVFMLNTLLASGFLAGCIAIVGRNIAGIISGFALIFIFGIINSLKLSILQSPLFAWDLLYVWQMCALGSSILSKWLFSAIALAVFSAIAFTFYKVLKKTDAINLKLRLAAIFFALGLAVLPLWQKLNPDNIINSRNIAWDQNENYRNNGFFLAFAMNIGPVMINQPDKYDRELVARLLEHNDELNGDNRGFEGQPVSLIVFMSESFSD